MHPPSPPPAVSPLIEQGATSNDFNVAQFLVDKSPHVLSKGEINIDQYGSNISEGMRHLSELTDDDFTHPSPHSQLQHPSLRVSH